MTDRFQKNGKSVIRSLPFDCHSKIIEYFRSKRDFFSLVLCVKGLYEYVKKINPSCTSHITFYAFRFPTTRQQHVTCVEVGCYKSTRNESDRSESNNENEVTEFFRRISESFSNLLKLTICSGDRLFYSRHRRRFKKDCIFHNTTLLINTNTTPSNFGLSNLKRLHINFKDSNIEIDKNFIFPNLTDLVLHRAGSFNPPDNGDEGIDDLKRLDDLKVIHWSGTFPKLLSLSLGGWRVMSSIFDLPFKKQLRRLSLGLILFDDIEEAEEEEEKRRAQRNFLSNFTKLKHLHLEKWSMCYFEHLENNFELEKINLYLERDRSGLGRVQGAYFNKVCFEEDNNNNNDAFFDSKVLTFRLRFENLPNLQKIDFYLFESEELPLERLEFQKNDGSKGIGNEFVIRDLPNLKKMKLEGLEFIRIKFSNTPRLEIIDIARCKSIDLLHKIGDHSSVMNLKRIELQDCNIGETLLFTLQNHMKEMESLEFHHVRCTNKKGENISHSNSSSTTTVVTTRNNNGDSDDDSEEDDDDCFDDYVLKIRKINLTEFPRLSVFKNPNKDILVRSISKLDNLTMLNFTPSSDFSIDETNGPFHKLTRLTVFFYDNLRRFENFVSEKMKRITFPSLQNVKFQNINGRDRKKRTLGDSNIRITTERSDRIYFETIKNLSINTSRRYRRFIPFSSFLFEHNSSHEHQSQIEELLIGMCYVLCIRNHDNLKRVKWSGIKERKITNQNVEISNCSTLHEIELCTEDSGFSLSNTLSRFTNPTSVTLQNLPRCSVLRISSFWGIHSLRIDASSVFISKLVISGVFERISYKEEEEETSPPPPFRISATDFPVLQTLEIIEGEQRTSEDAFFSSFGFDEEQSNKKKELEKVFVIEELSSTKNLELIKFSLPMNRSSSHLHLKNTFAKNIVVERDSDLDSIQVQFPPVDSWRFFTKSKKIQSKLENLTLRKYLEERKEENGLVFNLIQKK